MRSIDILGGSTKSSTYRLLTNLIDSNRLFSDFSAIYSRFDSIRLTDSTSTKPTDHTLFSILIPYLPTTYTIFCKIFQYFFTCLISPAVYNIVQQIFHETFRKFWYANKECCQPVLSAFLGILFYPLEIFHVQFVYRKCYISTINYISQHNIVYSIML